MEKQEFEQMMLKNVSVKWAKVIKAGKAYDDSHPDEWSVNMYVTQEDSDALIERGVACKEDKEGGSFFVAKRSTKTRAGDNAKPPVVVDVSKAPFTEEIGNGSVCNVIVTLFPWSKGKAKGVKLYLQGVQVVTHVPYGGGASMDFEPLEGEAVNF